MNPFDVLFSKGGAAALSVLADALTNARLSGCECETCTMLRASVDAMADLLDNAEGDSGS